MSTLGPDLQSELEAIADALTTNGLVLAGAFHLDADGPAMPSERQSPAMVSSPIKTVALIANIGSTLWSSFKMSDAFMDGQPHPLDRWSRARAGELAAHYGAAVVMPSDGPPYYPFQRWARRATGAQPSPIGLLMHPTYGLWWALRAALVFDRELALGAFAGPEQPQLAACDTCEDRPCLTTCPVSAFKVDGYDVATCRSHVQSPEGEACARGSCLARRACPIARDLAYGTEHATFHMDAFAPTP